MSAAPSSRMMVGAEPERPMVQKPVVMGKKKKGVKETLAAMKLAGKLSSGSVACK